VLILAVEIGGLTTPVDRTLPIPEIAGKSLQGAVNKRSGIGQIRDLCVNEVILMVRGEFNTESKLTQCRWPPTKISS
jgi:hypothetical protein